MAESFDSEGASQASEGVFTLMRDREERYGVASNGYTEAMWADAVSPDDFRVQSEGPLQTWTRFEMHPQAIGTHGSDVDGGFSRRDASSPAPPQYYINPAALALPEALPIEAQIFNDDHRQALYRDDYVYQPTVSSSYAGVSRDDHVSRLDTVCSGGDGQSHEVCAQDWRSPHISGFTPASAETILNASAMGPDSAFIPEVLERRSNHQQRLNQYTDGLMHAVGAQMYGSQGHADLPLSSDTRSLRPENMTDTGCAKNLAPRPLQTIQAQSDYAPGGVRRLTSRNVPMCRVRESTPVSVNTNAGGVKSGLTSNDRLHPHRSSVVFDAPSPTNSDVSTEFCPFDGCKATFTGHYRRGNLGRHRRQMHAGQKAKYPCQDEYCDRVFQRKDARLKHHRKAHPYLKETPAVSRRASSSMASDGRNSDHVTRAHSEHGFHDGGDVMMWGDEQSF